MLNKIDEAGAHISIVSSYGKAEGVKRLKMPKPVAHEEKFSIIGAISIVGIMTFMYCNGAKNFDGTTN